MEIKLTRETRGFDVHASTCILLQLLIYGYNDVEDSFRGGQNVVEGVKVGKKQACRILYSSNAKQ